MITSPAINPGRFDRRITLRSRVETRGTDGAALVGYADQATVSASRLPQNGREFMSAQARNAEASDLFRIRYRADVAATWQVVLGGVAYKIIAPPLEVGRREYLDIPCVALNGAAPAATAAAFTVDLAEGDTEKVIVFAPPFGRAPRGLKVQLLIPAGGFNFGADIVADTIATTGFTVALGAEVPAAGYKLSVIAVQ